MSPDPCLLILVTLVFVVQTESVFQVVRTMLANSLSGNFVCRVLRFFVGKMSPVAHMVHVHTAVQKTSIFEMSIGDPS